jgi:Flp pilus assembly protein TadG
MKQWSDRKSKAPGRTSGVAIVEFTVTLPLLLLLIFVTAEFGRAFMQYNTLTKSVRDSVRILAAEAVLGQTGLVLIDADLSETIKSLTVYGDMTGAGTPILPGLTTADVAVTASETEGDVRVSAVYQYNPIFTVVPLFGLGNDISPSFTLQTETTMRAL